MSEIVNEPTASTSSPPSTSDGRVITMSEGTSLIAAEYGSIRAEILQLVGLQAQLITLTVLAFGTILSVGFQADNPVIVSMYPPLALILGISWLNHAHAIHRCGGYIALQIEPKVGSQFMGWEAFVRANPLPRGRIGYWGMRAIFIGSSVLAVIAGTVIRKAGFVPWLFYCVAVAVTVLTTLLFLVWREGPIRNTVSGIPPNAPAQAGDMPITPS